MATEFKKNVSKYFGKTNPTAFELYEIQKYVILKLYSQHALRLDWADVFIVAEVAITEPDEIDEIGIVGATKLAMERCIQNSLISPEHLLIDAIKLDGLLSFRSNNSTLRLDQSNDLMW